MSRGNNSSPSRAAPCFCSATRSFAVCSIYLSIYLYSDVHSQSFVVSFTCPSIHQQTLCRLHALRLENREKTSEKVIGSSSRKAVREPGAKLAFQLDNCYHCGHFRYGPPGRKFLVSFRINFRTDCFHLYSSNKPEMSFQGYWSLEYNAGL